jgi:hypothetical protein
MVCSRLQRVAEMSVYGMSKKYIQRATLLRHPSLLPMTVLVCPSKLAFSESQSHLVVPHVLPRSTDCNT